MKKVKKVWGYENIIVNADYCGKILVLKRGYKSSLHYHALKDETFYINRGKVLMVFGDKEKRLKQGDIVHIPVGLYHSFQGITDAEIIEFSTYDDPKDSYRVPAFLSCKVDVMKAYDYDGVASTGMKLQEGAPIITGRSFEEMDKVKIKGHPIYFNPVSFNKKDYKNSAKWKAKMIKKLGIEEFFEDDCKQADIIEKLCPNCYVNRVNIKK